MPSIHEILPLHDLLFGLLVPLGMAIAIYGVAAVLALKGRPSAWAAPLAVGGGFAAAYVGISGGMPGFPPVDVGGVVCCGAVALAIVGVLLALMDAPRAAEICAAMMGAFILSGCVILRSKSDGAAPSVFVTATLLSILAMVLAGCIRTIAERMSGALMAFVLASIVGMTAMVFGMTGSASLAKETGAMALTFLPAWVIAMFVPALSLRRGLAMTFVPLWVGLTVTHVLFSYSEEVSPKPALGILAAIPILLCVTSMAWMRRWPKWQFIVVNVLATILPAAIAVGIVAVAFSRSMRQGQEGM